MKFLSYTLLLSCLAASQFCLAEFRVINSVKCAEKIPDAKAIMSESERSQKVKQDEFAQIEKDYKKLSEEIQKDYSELMTLQNTSPNSDSCKKARIKVEEKQAKLNDLQKRGERLMQEAQMEMQMAQMRLQPYLAEVIQNTVEVASKNPLIDAVWDEATRTFVYTKGTCDLNTEVIKVTEKKVEQKSTTVAKNKTDSSAKVA